MPTYEINKEIVFSSAHITTADDLLFKGTTPVSTIDGLTVTMLDGGYGFRIILDFDALKGFNYTRNGLSEAFANIVSIAKDKECNILILDCDGTYYSWLPQYAW